MGLSNPAVCRLNQTWEVSASQTAVKITINLTSCSLWVPFVSTETSQQVQKVLQGIWKLDGKLMKRFLSKPMLNWKLVLCSTTALSDGWSQNSLTVSTGPIQEPSGVPTDSCQAGSSNHSLYAAADQRSDLLIWWQFIINVMIFPLYLHHSSHFYCRYDVHPWGQQDIYRQFGQFWENGEVLKVQTVVGVGLCLAIDITADVSFTFLCSFSGWWRTQWRFWDIVGANRSVSVHIKSLPLLNTFRLDLVQLRFK